MMPAWKRILIGALGASMPILLMIVKIDVSFIINNPHVTYAHLVGFGIKYICLAVIGATVAYLNDEITKPLTIFQIGLGAPALLASLITSNGIASIQKEVDEIPKRYKEMQFVPFDSAEFKAMEISAAVEKELELSVPVEKKEPETLTEKITEAVGDVTEAITGEVYEKTLGNTEDGEENPMVDSITGDGYKQIVPNGQSQGQKKPPAP